MNLQKVTKNLDGYNLLLQLSNTVYAMISNEKGFRYTVGLLKVIVIIFTFV